MPTSPPEYPSLTCVEWIDAMNIAAWQPLSEVAAWATGDGFLCRNVGYLVHEDDNCVVLAARFNLDGPDGDDSQVGLFERLPKGMIVRRWLLEEVGIIGGKPSKGTPADKRLGSNKGGKGK